MGDYFTSEEQAASVFESIQHKLVGAMLRVEDSKGRKTGADHYISGVRDHRISSLVGKLIKDVRGLDQVFGIDSLPHEAMQLSRSQRRHIVDRLHFEIVSAILVMMRDQGHLYYMAGNGYWQFSDVICRAHNHAAREARQAWRNERNYHGRPSQQGRRRTAEVRMAPNVYVGYIAT